MTNDTAVRWPVRALTDADFPALMTLLGHAFGELLHPELVALERRLTEWDRTLGAHDGDLLVGSTQIYSFTMSLPGGERAVAGVTGVGVLPTHRRRGVLSALMHAQLRDLHDSGREAVAALWASEQVIYGRFGYGVASREFSLTVPRTPRLLGAADPTLRTRLVVTPETRDDVEPVWEAVRAQRPGLHRREGAWRDREIADIPALRSGRSELRTVLAEDASGVRGYARYAVEDRPSGASVVHVRELVAADPAAYRLVLGFVLDLDLTSSVRLPHRPTDDPALDLLPDARSAQPVVRDGLHVRLVDLDRALAERTYATAAEAVLEIEDEVCPWNAGRWRVALGPTGAEVTRTDAEPDVVLPVAALGAAYLGSAHALGRWHRAGLMEERRPGAVRALSTAFTGAVEPWAPIVW